MTTTVNLVDDFLRTVTLDTSSPENGAVFFSGAKAKRAAKKACKSSDFKNVTQTEALEEFNKWQKHCYGSDGFLSLQDYFAVGDWISEKFAQDASGSVAVYLDGVKPHGTFARAEIPALIANDKVTDFTVYDFAGSEGKPEPVSMSKSEFGQYMKQKLEGVRDRRFSSAAPASEHQPALA